MPFVPSSRSLRVLAAAARDCAGCPLYRAATHTVFGDGPRDARVVLVGEQPGEREDLTGEPFVGPAGRSVPIGTSRGRPIDVGGRPMIVTYHPSAVSRGDERAATIRAALVDDLRLAAGLA